MEIRKMTKEEEKLWMKKRGEFRDKFGYSPAITVWKYGNWFEEYIWALEESVKDGFDYTIELYGTVPEEHAPPAEYCID